jgi:hypothetical protein
MFDQKGLCMTCDYREFDSQGAWCSAPTEAACPKARAKQARQEALRVTKAVEDSFRFECVLVDGKGHVVWRGEAPKTVHCPMKAEMGVYFDAFAEAMLELVELSFERMIAATISSVEGELERKGERGNGHES